VLSSPLLVEKSVDGEVTLLYRILLVHLTVLDSEEPTVVIVPIWRSLYTLAHSIIGRYTEMLWMALQRLPITVIGRGEMVNVNNTAPPL
jgi:hypothetical protein